MPLKIATITSASLSTDNKTLTVNGDGFGENQYPVLSVGLSTDGVTFNDANSIVSSSDEVVVGTYTIAITPGNYYVRIITNDKTTVVSGNTEITVSSTITIRTNISISISIGSF